MKTIIVCLFLFLLGPFTATLSAQTQKLDSLWSVYNDKKQSDTNRLKAIEEIAWSFADNKPDTAIILAEQQRQLAEKEKQFKYEAKSLILIGVSFVNKSNYQKGLEFFREALTIYKETNNEVGQAACYNNMGAVYNYQGDYPKTLEYYLKSLAIEEKIGAKKGLGDCYNNIGVVYYDLSEYAKALEYHQKALKIQIELGDKLKIGNSYVNIGAIYQSQANYSKAEESYSGALKNFEEVANKRGIATCYIYLGNLFSDKVDFTKALDFLFRSLEIQREIGDQQGMAGCYNSIGSDYIKLTKFNLAIQYSDSGLLINRKIGDLEQERESYRNLASAYSKTGKYKEAFENYILFKTFTDSIFNTDKSKQLGDLKTNFEVEKKETELKAQANAQQAIAVAEKKRQRTIIYAVAGMLIIVMVFSVFLFRRFKITQKQNVIIEKQKRLVEEHQKEIVDSINYARRLQRALLPSLSEIHRHLPDCFVLYCPKDIVAGDFYWMYASGDVIFIASADCTGHGVPGALVSVVCSNALNRTVKEFGLRDTGKILDKVTELVLETFEKSGEEIRDGMDISLLSVNKATKVIQWSGANTPLWIVRGTELTELKADKQHIGKNEQRLSFATHTLPLTKDETFYLITDGYSDQFGLKNKKLMKKKFKEILLSIQDKTLSEQKTFLEDHHNQWKGNMEQTDDVTVLGLRL